MKKTSYFKKALLLVAFVAPVLFMASCGNSQKSRDAGDVAQEQNEKRFDDNQQENDAEFLVKAAENNLKQIQLGQLAQQKGTSAQVKELGKMMEDAHTKSQNDLTALARNKMMTIPTSLNADDRDAYEDLNEKSGNDFDQAYVDMMVDKQEDAIETFETATTDRYDTDIKQWAIATLPELRTNLNHSLALQKKNEEGFSK